MTNVYACLAGNWVNLNDDPNCVMGINHASPSIWYEENAVIYSPLKRDKGDTLYTENSTWINYKGRDYLINPIFIQIVTE